jgi:hypothetical protein
MRSLVITLAVAFCGLASAADNPYAGSWKLNPMKSVGPPPACLQNGILRLPAEIYTGPKSAPATVSAKAARAPQASRCGVYFFQPSPDGRTLTVTQPQEKNPTFKSVFEKQ